MENKWLGIDPGGNGGLVVLNNEGTVEYTCKCPTTDTEILEVLQMYSPSRGLVKTVVYVEKLWGHGGLMGSKASIWTQAENYGKLIMGCIATGMELHEIAPGTWQKEYGMKKDKGMTPKDWKAQLRDRARKMFPQEDVPLWKADALLIARYCYKKEKGGIE